VSPPITNRYQLQALLRYRLLDPLDDALQEYADYLGKPFAEVRAYFDRMEATGWAELSGPEIDEFRLMLFPLQLPHILDRLQTMFAFYEAYPNPTFLDIGAGVGRDCIAFARKGAVCTHADVPWPGVEFARWRYRQRKLAVRIVDARYLPEERFTFVSCHDVFEHVDDPVDLLVKFVAHTAYGGLLFTSLDLFNPIPTHQPKNDFYSTLYDPLLRELGMNVSIGHPSPTLDAAGARIRIYQRMRPAEDSIEAELMTLRATAYDYCARELTRLERLLTGESARVRAIAAEHDERQLSAA
jgi:SAM-dependent methyltransferase